MKKSQSILAALAISIVLGGGALYAPVHADDLDDQVSDLQGQIILLAWSRKTGNRLSRM